MSLPELFLSSNKIAKMQKDKVSKVCYEDKLLVFSLGVDALAFLPVLQQGILSRKEYP